MREIILSLAPTGAFGKKHNNPISPSELIQAAVDCYAAGAAIIHLHARDLQGNLTTDMTLLQETFRGINEHTGLLIEASTGGLSDFTSEERGLPTTVVGADMGSLNLGSLNFGDEVYCNTPPAVDFWITQMAHFSVKPALEIFDTGHLAFARSLIDEGKLAPVQFFLHLQCSLGHGLLGRSARISALSAAAKGQLGSHICRLRKLRSAPGGCRLRG